MWLGDYRLKSTKKLGVHRTIHVNRAGRKVITLENIDMCYTAWYTIRGNSLEYPARLATMVHLVSPSGPLL